jgi:hypothetical protein
MEWKCRSASSGHAFADLGEQKARNIAQAVRAFKVRMGEAPDDVKRRPGRIVTLRQKARLLTDSRRKN